MLKYQTIVDFSTKHKCVEYTRYGVTHRIGGHAVIWDDHDISWHEYGEYHRKDGPARIWDQFTEYWIRGEEKYDLDFDEI
jgi:hypothetical protein